MKWRESAGLTIAVLALLGFGSQPFARWVVTRTVNRYVPGGAATAGSVSWDPVRHTWTCDQFRLRIDGVDSFLAARATVLLDSNALMNRNLLVKSARVDGAVIPISERALLPSSDYGESSSTFASFRPEMWLDTQLQQYKSQILSASRRREQRHQELLEQWNRLQSRCEEVQVAATPNPLRTRTDIQEVRRDFANLFQVLAEERIQIRETDRELEKPFQRLRDTWREDLREAIVHPLPDRTRLVQQIAEKCLMQYWDSRRLLLRCASITARPLVLQESILQGTEVKIAGMPNRYVKIRMAALAGCIDIEAKKQIRFRASVNGWGDASSPGESEANWYFEIPGIGAPLSIRARMEDFDRTISSAPQYRDRIAFAWTEKSEPSMDCQGRWHSYPDGDRFELSLPVDCIADLARSHGWAAFDGQSDWESCWGTAIENYRGSYLLASLTLSDQNNYGIADDWRCDHTEVSKESLELVSLAWDRTLTAYLATAGDRIEPRLAGLHRAMEKLRNLYWTEENQSRIDSISQIEHDAVSLRNRWEEYCKRSDRVAHLRVSGEGY